MSIISILYNLLILCLLISSIFLRSSIDRNKLLKQLLLWLIIIFIGTLIYNYKNKLNLFTETSTNTEQENK